VLTAIKNIGGDPEEVVPALARFVKANHGPAATVALAILQEYGPKAADAAPTLAGLLKDPKAVDLYGPAAEALFKIDAERAKKEAVPALRKRLKVEPGNLACARALAVIDPGDKDALKVIADNLRSPNYTNRMSAAQAIGAIGPRAKKLTADLKGLLKDPSPYVRAVAALALWRVTENADDALTPLLALLKDAQPATRSYAASTLTEMGPAAKKAVPALRIAYADADVNVRTTAGGALKKIDPEAAAKAGVH
jgi:HEAT repeat protein